MYPPYFPRGCDIFEHCKGKTKQRASKNTQSCAKVVQNEGFLLKIFGRCVESEEIEDEVEDKGTQIYFSM